LNKQADKIIKIAVKI